MEFSNILLETSNNISTIIINRPKIRNALDIKTWEELDYALKMVDEDHDTKAIVVTGAGDEAFAAGADINWLNKREMLNVLSYGAQDVLLKLENLSKPTIAAVNGLALGGGCELAMACDIRVASANAKFGQPEVNLGIIPGAGGTQRLTKLVGYGKAKELILTGDIIDAEEAMRIGLINKLTTQEDLMKVVLTMANKIISKGPVAIKLAKLAINIGLSTDVTTGMAFEKLAQTIIFATEDRIEGTESFLEKRKANFKGK